MAVEKYDPETRLTLEELLWLEAEALRLPFDVRDKMKRMSAELMSLRELEERVLRGEHDNALFRLGSQ